MDNLLSGIYRSLQKGEEVVVATVVSVSGSTPRTSGSRMVVYRDGSIEGTIGGGAVEADVICKALECFTGKDAVIASYNLNNPAVNDHLDLICGGRMEVLIEYVASDDDRIELYRMLHEGIQASRPLLWIGKLQGDKNAYKLDRSLLIADGQQWVGSFPVTSDLEKKLIRSGSKLNAAGLHNIGDHKYVVESIQPQKTVYLVGGGHVSLALANMIQHIEFRTIIIDDRPEFANSERFPSAAGVYVCPDYRSLFERFNINTGSYIIIVTRGHRFDKEALAQALKTEAGYIGMIGSRKKRNHIYRLLENEGVDAGELDRVHCPVGLSIEAETPAEIAVSIVAQLIQHRAALKSHG